jgi:hypothetical protein
MPLRGLDLERVERAAFPVETSYAAPLHTVLESLGTLAGTVAGKLDETLAAIRERFEGGPMPFGLSDDEVWAWYKEHFTAGGREH